MRRATLIFAGLLFTAAYVLAGETPLISAPVVAPATGTVSYQRQGSQEQVSVRVTAMKPASQLKPSPRKVYVVWLQEPNKNWRNLGVLQVANGNGVLTAAVPAGNMFVLITAENNAHGSSPAGPEVMQATVLGQ